MADKEIKITFPEEKMEALVFFLGEQNEKSVPAQVRKFVESRIPAAEEESVQGQRGQRPAREPGRRSVRQSMRQTAQEQTEPVQTAQEDVQTGPEEETASENTMSMGM